MSQKLDSYNWLNLEGSTVSITDLAAWGRMWTSALLRWQQRFWSAAVSFREERKVSWSFVLFYADNENSILQENWADCGLIVETVFMGTSQAGWMVNTFYAETVSLVFGGRCWTCSTCMIQEVTGLQSPCAWKKVGGWPSQKGLHWDLGIPTVIYGLHANWVRVFSPDVSTPVSPDTKGTERFF